MFQTLRRLSLGIILILGASGILLVSDLGSRSGAKPRVSEAVKRVALLQHASQPILEEGVRGLIEGLAEKGFVEGKNLSLRRYNAEGDVAVSNTIAKDMVTGDYDLLMTVSTPSLQAVANANQSTKRPLVFGLVTDPSVSGVGVSKENPLDHPAWLAGFGTMQPIKQAFDIVRTLNPNVKRIGVVWNAAEANAEAQLKIARQICKDANIELLETTVDSSAGVSEAVGAVCARGIDVLFCPGDVTVLTAFDGLMAAANKSGVPVFTVIPPNARKGAIFDIGANYYEVGRHTGELAAEILAGRDPATVEIVNFVPETLIFNEQALAGYEAKGWRLPQSLRDRAQLIIDRSGQEVKGASAPSPTPRPAARTKPLNIQVVLYSESLPAEETLQGLQEGMKGWSLQQGKDYTVKIRNAQGDMGALSGVLDAAITDNADIVVPLSTPSLQAAIRKIRERPIVFSLVANPMAAGAGKSYEDHLPNVTGISVLAPADAMLDLIRKHFPQYKRIGTLFCPAEANSVDLKDILVTHGKERGFIVDTVAVNSPAELADAAMSLAGRPIDAIVQISDNISSAGFTAISKAARQTRKPLFSLNSTTVPLGAPVALGRDYLDCGRETAVILERVAKGESPAKIPIQLPPRVVKTASLPNAAAVGMELPPEFLAEMETVIEK